VPREPYALRSRFTRRAERIARARELVAEGHPLDWIAMRLEVSPRTLQDYLKPGSLDPSWKRRPSRRKEKNAES
jgi:DNA-binding CsgD family transcriptional regulator